MSDTPRTDAEEQWAEWNGNEFQCVHSDFAREMERKADALKAINAELLKAVQMALIMHQHNVTFQAAIKKATE